MSKWYECKIKYRKFVDNEQEKLVNEVYLFDALSFTEAERRTTEEMSQYISGEFLITNIKVSNLAEIHPNENGDRWFKCKVSFITLDEERGKEKKSNTYMLVQANDLREAYDNLENALSDMSTDYEIPNIAESPILEVFPYFGNDEVTNEEAPEGFVSMGPSRDFDQKNQQEETGEVVYDASEEEEEAEE